AVFATTDTADTGTTLYYIPVIPLYRLLQGRRSRKGAQLLLSVCSYLCRIAGVPYYREDDSYLNWHYEMFAEMLADDAGNMDAEDYEQDKSALNRAAYYGDIMGKRIYHSYQLECFEQRIHAFLPRNTWDADCLKAARTAFDLWRQYPDGHLLKHAPETADEDENEEPPVRIYEYVSFISETKGGLFSSLSEMVNSEFNERTQLDEPVVITHYDGSETEQDSLDFERRLFDLIIDICDLINE
ncbi:MAG: hypothetical protein JST19_22225, partial [Bacteroidetes bacterium]|nr:hypothetical protein [Bacteroidota bacterium]